MSSAGCSGGAPLEASLAICPRAEGATEDRALLTLWIDKRPPVLGHVHWILSVDRSGSMADICKDGRSKADQIKHTIRNLVRYLRSSAGPSHSLRILSFDGSVSQIVSAPGIDNLDDATLDVAMEGLSPRGVTDIEKVLKRASSLTEEVGVKSGEHVVHVLLTDGHITAGETRHSSLARMSTNGENVRTAYLGYGAEHCSHLLETLAGSGVNSCYYFVDSLEHAGMVYGEVLHKCTHEQVHSITISVTGGEVYDLSTSKWTREMKMSPLESEGARSAMVRWAGADRPVVRVEYKMAGSGHSDSLSTDREIAWVEGDRVAMQYQLTRQRCLEAMARAKRALEEEGKQDRVRPLEHAVLDAAKRGVWAAVWPMLDGEPSLVNTLPAPRRYGLIHHAAEQRNRGAIQELARRGAVLKLTLCGQHPSSLAAGDRECLELLDAMSGAEPLPCPKKAALAELDALLDEIRRDHPLEVRDRYKQLADDIYVTRLSLSAADRSVGAMYMCARAASQGEGRAYRVGDIGALETNQTEEGQAYRSLTQSYTVEPSGTSSHASMGALEAMDACMVGSGNRSTK